MAGSSVEGEGFMLIFHYLHLLINQWLFSHCVTLKLCPFLYLPFLSCFEVFPPY